MDDNKNCGCKEGTLPDCAPLAMAYVPMQQSVKPVYSNAEALSRGTLFPGLDLPFMNILPCIRTHSGTVFQQSVFIGAQSIDNFVKLHLELVRFPLYSGVRPSGIKAVSRAVKISTQMTDIGGLSLKLHTLSIGVFLLGRG